MNLLSGGHAIRGCAFRSRRVNVVPERWHPTKKTGRHCKGDSDAVVIVTVKVADAAKLTQWRRARPARG
jgi:hypothetical protein